MTTETLRAALKSASKALCRMELNSVERAEAAVSEALEIARQLVAADRLRPGEWPVAELAQCRRMTETCSQYWERRRAATACTEGYVPPASFLG